MIIRSMGCTKIRWNAVFLLALVSVATAVVNNGGSDNEGPPGLIDIKNVDDLVAEASVETQKREIPAGGLSNSYGEPIPADSYGPPSEDSGHSIVISPQPIPISDSYGPPTKQDIGLPIPIYGVPDDSSNHIKYPEPPPDIPPPIPTGGGIPHQTYGPPQLPHDNYGPPPSFGHHSGGGPNIPQYHGPPPPPQYGPPPPQFGPPPKPQYGPPKQQFGPPKPHYGPPKPQFGPPKQSYGPPKQQYGPPKQQFGPPKIQYGPPKPHFGPPKQQYGPPKQQYGPPKPQFSPPPRQEYGPPKSPHPIYGPPISHFNNNQPLKPSFPIPEDTYGPPGRPISPGEQFSQHISSDSIFGPPIGIHHGPPQPDPNPKPAHPGIPAPPTPPHILYDGWTPIPGLVSKPPGGHIGGHGGHNGGLQDNYGPPPPPPEHGGSFISSLHSTGGSFGIPSGSYGVPVQSLDIHSSGGSDHSSNSFISSGYSSVAGNEGLQGIDLNSIIGSSHGDAGIGLQGSKTVFEAHYTEGGNSHGGIESASHGGDSGKAVNSHGNSFSVLQSLGFDLSSIDSVSGSHASSISTSFQAPPGNSISHGPFPGPRQLASSSHSFGSDIGLKPPSGIYGVPPGGKYGVPPPPPPHNTYRPPPPHHHNHHQLSISYGVPSGSVGTGNINPLGISPPKRPISFREPVPQGLIENIGNSVAHKDHLGIDDAHFQAENTYLPPPVPDRPQSNFIHDQGQFSSHNSHSSQSSHNSGFSIQASIEPSNLYSLPSIGNPISFQGNNHGSNQISGYSSNIDSYNAPLSTVSDSYGAPSIESSVTTTLDGKTVSKSESSDGSVIGTDAASLAAAILKNCPYHKALYEAAKNVEFNSQSKTEVGNSASSSSNTFKLLPPENNAVIFSNAESQSNEEKNKEQKGKSLNNIEDVDKPNFQQYQSLALQATEAQQQNDVNHQQILGQNYEVLNGVHSIPVHGNLGSYTLQIQSANGLGPQAEPSDVVPHEQVLSEGLLQSILQAIEQPHQTQIIPQEPPSVKIPQNEYFDLSQSPSGLVLPDGYEIEPRKPSEKTKSNHRGDQGPPEDPEEQGSENKPVIIVAPQNSEKISKSFLEQFGLRTNSNDEKEPEIVTPLNIIDDNEIAVYFNSHKNDLNFDYENSDDDKDNEIKDTEDESPDRDSSETVTEISVETSISASDDESQESAQYYSDDSRLEKKGKFGDKIVKKVDSKSEDKHL